MNVEETDQAGQAAADQGKGHRISLDYMTSQIGTIFYTDGEAIAAHASHIDRFDKTMPAMSDLAIMTVCMMVMKNGFIVFGKSAPLSIQNFKPDLGRKFAYDDCIRQLWPMYAFSTKQAHYEGWG